MERFDPASILVARSALIYRGSDVWASFLPGYPSGIFDGFVKSPSAALRGNFVVAVPKEPHASVFARLPSGAFYKAIGLATFYESIKNGDIIFPY